MCSSLNTVFVALRDNLRNVALTLESDGTRGDKLMTSPGEWQQYWSTFEGYAASVSQSCHVLAISFRSLPLPTTGDADDMKSKLECAAVGILQAYAALSPHQGRRFVAQVRAAALEVVTATLNFVEEAFCKGYPKTPDGLLAEDTLSLVGVVAEKCLGLQTLPRSPALLIQAELQRQFQLVNDALGELEEAKNEGDGGGMMTEEENEFEVSYTEEDLKLLMPALGLFKTVKALIKKVSQTVKKNGNSDTVENIKQLEELSDVCSRISPCIDEYSEVLYPPIEPEEVRAKSRIIIQLSNEIHSTLVGKHYSNDEEVKQWREFLLKALKHNEMQVEVALTGQELGKMLV